MAPPEDEDSYTTAETPLRIFPFPRAESPENAEEERVSLTPMQKKLKLLQQQSSMPSRDKVVNSPVAPGPEERDAEERRAKRSVQWSSVLATPPSATVVSPSALDCVGEEPQTQGRTQHEEDAYPLRTLPAADPDYLEERTLSYQEERTSQELPGSPSQLTKKKRGGKKRRKKQADEGKQVVNQAMRKSWLEENWEATDELRNFGSIPREKIELDLQTRCNRRAVTLPLVSKRVRDDPVPERQNRVSDPSGMLDAVQTVKSSAPPVLRSGMPEYMRWLRPEDMRTIFGSAKRRVAPVSNARKSIDDTRMSVRKSVLLDGMSPSLRLSVRKSLRKSVLRDAMTRGLFDKKEVKETKGEILAPKPTVPIDPFKYSSRFRLDVFEVKHILRLLREADASKADGIDEGDFRNVLASIYETPPENLAEATVSEAWTALLQDRARSARTGEEQLDGFFHWYTQNFFNSAIRGPDTELAGALPKRASRAQELWHRAYHRVSGRTLAAGWSPVLPVLVA